MTIYENSSYLDDVKYVARLNLPWEKLKNRSIMLSGATGLIGSLLVDVVMQKNREGLNCTVFALGRSEVRMSKRFQYCFEDPLFRFVEYDVKQPLCLPDVTTIDYVLHLASNTHPRQYATDPIGTITTNMIGLQNLLDFAIAHQATRFAFASSVEIYGENRGDVEKFDEKYCGYIDCNTMRAGYPESKRCGEALCQAYKAQKGMDIVIARLTRSYGPTLLKTDTKALSQFLYKGIAGEDIILKSAGTQYYSYLHAVDSVSGLLTVLLKGESGEAYNIADAQSDITLRDLAQIIAHQANTAVKFEIPDAVEQQGYSKATKAILDSTKLKALGWSARYTIRDGISRTIKILKETQMS